VREMKRGKSEGDGERGRGILCTRRVAGSSPMPAPLLLARAFEGRRAARHRAPLSMPTQPRGPAPGERQRRERGREGAAKRGRSG